ncbi:flagellar hook-basal body complex protein FliE [Oricola cellulosilytica]|uniref:Flagellar hook-basal body complex protein FliE n=1 Tax=Oricola cellulosilytica TaxID=1429082 RepID=A0A4R0PEG9_9HYPH|nr:flagellar hook-basal body complex protein FliE [Oricola cellulosilytica]TCD16197.1 flagellar hook-basal body complex protein FliE [Oricola cellulosilytica]
MALDIALSSIPPLESSDFGSAGRSAAVAPTPDGAAGFAEALKGMAENAVTNVKGAEQLSLKALSGEADIREVTDAVMSAEQSLQAAIAIRDKIVTAFLEVSRMQI